jgi:hypothetical protein
MIPSVAFIQTRIANALANALANATFGASNVQDTFACAESVAVNDVVYSSGSNTVAKASANDLTQAPALGIVVAKPTTTSAKVLSYGAYKSGNGSYVIGAPYYLSTTPGALTATPPSGADDVIQVVGVAVTTAKIFFQFTQSTSRGVAGSANAPTYGFAGTSGIGLYLATSTTLALAAGGAPVLAVEPTRVTLAQIMAFSGASPKILSTATNQGLDIVPNGTGRTRVRNAADSATIFGVECAASGNAGLVVRRTDSSGTPGNATQNTPSGKAAFALGTNVVTITNDLILASSIVVATLETVDTTLVSIVATPGAGSCVFTGNENATADTKFSYVVLNAPA